jgi:hypothetical protein
VNRPNHGSGEYPNIRRDQGALRRLGYSYASKKHQALYEPSLLRLQLDFGARSAQLSMSRNVHRGRLCCVALRETPYRIQN